MSYKIKLTPTANIDIQDAVKWYNSKKEKLGNRFYSEVKKTFNKLIKNPFAFAIRYNNTRTVLLNDFPYMLHYYVDENKNTVVILTVLHTSRNPNLWKERNILE